MAGGAAGVHVRQAVGSLCLLTWAQVRFRVAARLPAVFVTLGSTCILCRYSAIARRMLSDSVAPSLSFNAFKPAARSLIDKEGETVPWCHV